MLQRIFLLLCILCTPLIGHCAKHITIGVVTDGEIAKLAQARQLFIGELETLTTGEFDVRLPDSKQLQGNWSIESIKTALNQLQNDPSVDMVLALGFVSSHIAATGINLKKPTFAPLVIDANLFGLPRKGDTSGKRYLSYLTEEVKFTDDLHTFSNIVKFKHLGLVVDETIFQSVPDLAKRSIQWAKENGLSLSFILNTAKDEDLAAKIPETTEAVMVAALPRLSPAGRQRFIQQLIIKNIPSYSLIGTTAVEQGMLAAEAPDSDWQRLARRNALNMQAVMLGEKARNQSVSFTSKRQLTINMATARMLEIYPPFEILNQAALLNQYQITSDTRWSLSTVAAEALQQNLDIQADQLGVDAGNEQVREARSTLLPQLNAAINTVQLDDDSQNVQNGFAAERSTSGTLSASQILYSESARSNLDVQNAQQNARIAAHNAVKLDIVQEATVAFLNVLKAQTAVNIQQSNLNLTRTNLNLARDRVQLGSANASDVFRWESQLATAHQSVLSARAQHETTIDNLNRVLHRPIKQRFETEPATLQDPSLLISRQDLLDLIDNQYAFNLMSDYFVESGVTNAPELIQLNAQIASAERNLKATRRAYYLPDINLTAQASRVFEEKRRTGISQQGENDHQFGLNFSLPLFEGGGRHARKSRARYELKQFKIQHTATRERIEQNVRQNTHAVRASYPSIRLSNQASVAARKNLELVRDNYSQGSVSIIDLLDAQDSTLQAEQNAADAVYNFLIDLMNLQRSVAGFDFFLDETGRNAAVADIKAYINRRGIPR